MSYSWNVKGNTAGSLIIWLGVIVASLIMVGWYVTNIYPTHIDVDMADNDLEEIKDHINNACQNIFYQARVNPTIETGTIIINDSNLCINTSRITRCRFLLCATNVTKTIKLKNMTYLVIKKDENFSFTAE